MGSPHNDPISSARRPRARSVTPTPLIGRSQRITVLPWHGVYCTRDDGFPVRIVLTHRRCGAYTEVPTIRPELLGCPERAPMLIQSQPGNRLRSRPAPRVHALTTSTSHRASSPASPGELVRLGPPPASACTYQDLSRSHLHHVA
jgi:hypothetical protein